MPCTMPGARSTLQPHRAGAGPALDRHADLFKIAPQVKPYTDRLLLPLPVPAPSKRSSTGHRPAVRRSLRLSATRHKPRPTRAARSSFRSHGAARHYRHGSRRDRYWWSPLPLTGEGARVCGRRCLVPSAQSPPKRLEPQQKISSVPCSWTTYTAEYAALHFMKYPASSA